MTSFLLDTNILLHYIRDDALWRRIVAEYHLENGAFFLFISIVVEAKIRALAEENKWGGAKRRRMENFLSSLPILPIDNRELEYGTVVEKYVQVSEYCRQNGRVLSKNDLWIAAAVMATSAGLLTTDKDFSPLDPLFLAHLWINPNL